MKQHFLPQCYLKEFCNGGGKLHTLDLDLLKYKRKVFDEQKFPVEVCKIPHFYTINKDIGDKFENLEAFYVEKLFHNYEREYPRLIKMVKNRKRSLQFSDAFLLLYAIIDIKIRNQHFRKSAIEDKKENVVDKLFAGYREELKNADLSDFPNITKDEMFSTMDNMRQEIITNPNYSKKSHLSTLIGDNKSNVDIHLTIINKLFKYQWVIFESDNQFITTDNPGASLDDNDRIHNTKFAGNIMFFMPLTPSYCLGINTVIVDINFQQNRKNKALTFAKAPNDFVDKINQAQTYYVNKHIFSSTKDKIDEIALRINSAAGI